jgi:hypothetical protein
VGDDRQARMAGLTGAPRGILDESAADPAAHRIRIDEEIDELGVVPRCTPAGEPDGRVVGIGGDTDVAGVEGFRIGAEDPRIRVEARRVLGPDVGGAAVDLTEQARIARKGVANVLRGGSRG